MEISRAEIAAWLQQSHSPEAIASRNMELDLQVENLLGVKQFIALHVDPLSFRVWKLSPKIREILSANGLGPNYDPIHTPKEVREQLLDDAAADQDGYFNFQPGRLCLAYTTEQVRVPLNEWWRMRSYFMLSSGETILLRTNLSAPSLKPGSSGPQTYEIVNEGPINLIIKVSELICPVSVSAIKESTHFSNSGYFTVQTGNKPSLGEFTRW